MTGTVRVGGRAGDRGGRCCSTDGVAAAAQRRRSASRDRGASAQRGARAALPRASRRPTRIRDAHRVPHRRAAPRRIARAIASWPSGRATFRALGLEDVAITTHEVLLPWPQEVSVEMTAPRRVARVDARGAGRRRSSHAACGRTQSGLPYHAYSASGDVTAPVVYAGSGNPEDYDWLAAQGIDVRGKIVLVRYSVPYSYRGFKALTAQQRGAAGILIYSDPADDGVGEGRGLSRRPVGARQPHPARRHRLRLPGARRSADARMGVDARRAAHRSRAKPCRCRRSSARRCRSRTRA